MSEFIRKFFASAITRAAEDADTRIIGGKASTFEEPEKHDSYGDIIAPEAFDEVLELVRRGLKKIKMLNSHGSPIGLWTEFSSSPAGGLRVRGKVSKVSEGNDVLELINDEVIDGLSIGFPYQGSKYEDLDIFTPWGTPVRRWTKINLREVSPTAFPANEFALIDEVRSARLAEYRKRAPDVDPSELEARRLGLLLFKAQIEVCASNVMSDLSRIKQNLGG